VHWLNLFAKFSVTERTAGRWLQAKTQQLIGVVGLVIICQCYLSLLMVSARHSEVPLWYRPRVRVRVRVSDWRTFAMAAPNPSNSRAIEITTVAL